jgi:hypothetical protein
VKTHLRLTASALMLAASCGCQMARDFLPRTHTTSTSPDGRYFAFVRQELNIDPPDDHLFLGAVGQTPKRLMDLGGDVDWCRTIVWSPDSRKVGFLIDDQRLAVFDVATAALEAMLVLVGDGRYGGMQEARHVAFSADSAEVSFERFDRATVLIRRRDGEIEAPVTSEAPEKVVTKERPIHRPARSHGQENVRIPARLRLRLIVPDGRIPAAPIYVRLVAADRREVTVRATPTGDGIFLVPAFDAGPLDVVQVFLGGRAGEGTILHGVRIDDGVMPVTIAPAETGKRM